MPIAGCVQIEHVLIYRIECPFLVAPKPYFVSLINQTLYCFNSLVDLFFWLK